jgi:hypothetical protein
MRPVRAIGLVWMLLLLAGLPARGGAKVHLEDGQVLEGISVESKAGFHELEIKTGAVITIPSELVAGIELTGKDAVAPSGIRPTEPETLAGPPGATELPRREDQLEALRDGRASFRRGVIDPFWHPESDWDLDPENNSFNPARWYQPPIDPTWRPTPAYTSSTDVTEFNPARWYRPPIDPIWRPTDGFRWRDR